MEQAALAEYIGLTWQPGFEIKLLNDHQEIKSVSVENADTEFDLNSRSDRIRVAVDSRQVIRSVTIG